MLTTTLMLLEERSQLQTREWQECTTTKTEMEEMRKSEQPDEMKKQDLFNDLSINLII